jgi:hypothetical protein
VPVHKLTIADGCDKEFYRKAIEYGTGVTKHTKIPPLAKNYAVMGRLLTAMHGRMGGRLNTLRTMIGLTGVVDWRVYSWDVDDQGKATHCRHLPSATRVALSEAFNITTAAAQFISSNFSDHRGSFCMGVGMKPVMMKHFFSHDPIEQISFCHQLSANMCSLAIQCGDAHAAATAAVQVGQIEVDPALESNLADNSKRRRVGARRGAPAVVALPAPVAVPVDEE